MDWNYSDTLQAADLNFNESIFSNKNCHINIESLFANSKRIKSKLNQIGHDQ